MAEKGVTSHLWRSAGIHRVVWNGQLERPVHSWSRGRGPPKDASQNANAEGFELKTGVVKAAKSGGRGPDPTPTHNYILLWP